MRVGKMLCLWVRVLLFSGRYQLAVPEPEPPRRSQREERNALRAAVGLPPYSA